MFRIASCSKSIAAAGLMLLVEEKKISLNQSLSSILGFPVVNPYFPNVDITVEMTLSHQSSLI
jgi:D-alanyl-D-alanine carboxypeptidase